MYAKRIMHMPICKAGIFPIGLISRKSLVGPLQLIIVKSTGFIAYSIPFKFNAMRTRHAHELRQEEYSTGLTAADIFLKKNTNNDSWTIDDSE